MYQSFAFLFFLNAQVAILAQADCLFCQRAHDTKTAFVKKFKHCFVAKDNSPVSPGHVLIIPYHHCDNWFSANSEIQADIMQALQEMKTLLDAELHPEGYNNVSSTSGNRL